MDVLKTSLKELRDGIKAKKFSSAEVTQKYLGQIEKWNSKINAYITVNDKAVDAAKKVDERLAKGEDVGPLAGVPIGIKDMFCTKGMLTTAGSKILENFVPPYSAT